MENEKQEAVTSTVAVQEGEQVTPTKEGGEQVTQPEKKENIQPFKVFNTQAEFENLSAKIKGSTEREILKLLGIKEKAEIDKIKQAYENSLTEADKVAREIENLKNENQELKNSNALALSMNKMLLLQSGLTSEEVETQAAMAQGLISKGIAKDYDEAFTKVFALIGKKEPEKPVIPHGKNITQPDTSTQSIKNPFKKGDDYSLDAQTELLKKDRELAIKLAKEAGVTLYN